MGAKSFFPSPSGYLLFQARSLCSMSTFTALPLHTLALLNPVRKHLKRHSQFLALPVSGAGFTTHLGPARTADSVSPVPTMGPSTLQLFIELLKVVLAPAQLAMSLPSLILAPFLPRMPGCELTELPSIFDPGRAGVHIT